MLWPIIYKMGCRISFAHTSFMWENNAANNAGVTCIIIGLRRGPGSATLYTDDTAQIVDEIGPYLVPGSTAIVAKSSKSICGLPSMASGNKATDGGNLMLSADEAVSLIEKYPLSKGFVKKLVGAREFIHGSLRYCLWIEEPQLQTATSIPVIQERIEATRAVRSSSRGAQANEAAAQPHRFVYRPHRSGLSILVPSVSSERREFLPCGLFNDDTVIVAPNMVLYDAPLWNLAVIASRLHLVWIATVCGKLKTDFRYSNTLGWNTFPIPQLTQTNRDDLTSAAENILLAREAHFPATIADLYAPGKMPDDLRAAHEANDEILERIYIGRRFRNDTERLEKLFQMYVAMTSTPSATKGARRGA